MIRMSWWLRQVMNKSLGILPSHNIADNIRRLGTALHHAVYYVLIEAHARPMNLGIVGYS